MDLITLALAKKYTEDSLLGAGAVKGEPGVSIINTYIDNNGHLIIEYSDNRPKEDLGVIIGTDGYTPQKGIDYYTEKEKKEMVNAVIAALPKAKEVAF